MIFSLYCELPPLHETADGMVGFFRNGTLILHRVCYVWLDADRGTKERKDWFSFCEGQKVQKPVEPGTGVADIQFHCSNSKMSDHRFVFAISPKYYSCHNIPLKKNQIQCTSHAHTSKKREHSLFIYTMNTVRHLSSTHALLQSLWAK
jgi:hypothetical protein